MLFILKCYAYINKFCKSVKPVRIIEASSYGDTGFILLSDNTHCYVGSDTEYKKKYKNKSNISIIIKNIRYEETNQIKKGFCKKNAGVFKYNNKIFIDKKEINLRIKTDYSLSNGHESIREFVNVTGEYPSPTVCNKLYDHIKNIVKSYFKGDLNDEEEEKAKYQSISKWKWDYFRLTKLGRECLRIYDKISKNGIKNLTKSELKIKKNAENGMYSEYLQEIFLDL